MNFYLQVICQHQNLISLSFQIITSTVAVSAFVVFTGGLIIIEEISRIKWHTWLYIKDSYTGSIIIHVILYYCTCWKIQKKERATCLLATLISLASNLNWYRSGHLNHSNTSHTETRTKRNANWIVFCNAHRHWPQ